MKLHNSTKVVILSLICLILLTTSPIPISGDFSEDFSDPTLEGWFLYISRPNETHTWGVQDDTLASTGTLYPGKFNGACHRTDVNPESSIWEFDLWGNNEGWQFGFQIGEFPLAEYDSNLEFGYTMPHFQLVVAAGMDSSGQNTTPVIRIVQYLNYFTFIKTIRPDDPQFRGWHHYRMERNGNDIKVFADGKRLLEAELATRYLSPNPYDSICMWTEIGSGVRVDNIKAVSRDDGGILMNPYFWGGLGIAVIGSAGFVTRNYFKKKA
ncbi:MAG: hypothetical protein ACXAB7_21410 [Candidatus Kariarchaeaceae archaeon]